MAFTNKTLKDGAGADFTAAVYTPGRDAASASGPVALSTEDKAALDLVAGRLPAAPTNFFLNSAATTNGALIITATAGLQSFYATNSGATVAFVKLYNKASAPTVGTDVPEMIIPVPAAVAGVPGVSAPIDCGFNGLLFNLGLGIAITGAATDADTTAVAAGQVRVKLSRTA